MRNTLVMCFVLLCIVQIGYGNLQEVLKSAVSSAWSSIIDVIKKPVRMKKLGPGAKHKTKPKPKAVTIDPHIWKSTDSLKAIKRIEDLFRRSEMAETEEKYRVTLPHLSVPMHNSLETRYRFRDKNYEHEKHRMKGNPNYPQYDPEPVTKKDPGDGHFGHLIFI